MALAAAPTARLRVCFRENSCHARFMVGVAVHDPQLALAVGQTPSATTTCLKTLRSNANVEQRNLAKTFDHPFMSLTSAKPYETLQL
jgi:hypothetical protein